MIEPGKTLLDIEIENSLDTLVERFSSPQYKGATIEIWVFDGADRRRAARDTLFDHGINASVQCSYKPLVHAALEELNFEQVSQILVRYPVIRDVPRKRFLLEAYPFADLAGKCDVRFEPKEAVRGRGLIAYDVKMICADGSRENHEVSAPNRFGTAFGDEQAYSPCGWLRVRSEQRPELNFDGPLRADQELAFRAVKDALETEAERSDEPYFDRLDIEVGAPFFDHPLAVGHETISTAEAMHEDLYFSALDVFKAARGLDAVDRTLTPGQIVPVLRSRNGPLRVKVATAADPDLAADKTLSPLPLVDLPSLDRWLEPAEIKAHIDDLDGEAFEVRSRRGRPVWGSYVSGRQPGILITAGQHANETSGPVGALRAAKHLAKAGQTGFAVAPMVNPDGYALFRELCRDYPGHMNHAARFTAAGCDLHHVERGFENEAHCIGKEKTDARLHMNLHGYPAHEWIRPFSGYIPRGADMWSIPRGFLLILFYNPGWEKQGRAVLEAVIDALASYAPLVALNEEQMYRSALYSDGFPFRCRGGIPFIIEERPEEMFPVTIITEAPDETVYGEAFRLFHTAQMKAVLAAEEAGRTILF
ncbi:MAG: M14 family zinc carboxypeptidase [Pseudomonadota bacterium]